MLSGSHDHLHLKDVALRDTAGYELLQHLLAVQPGPAEGITMQERMCDTEYTIGMTFQMDEYDILTRAHKNGRKNA